LIEPAKESSSVPATERILEAAERCIGKKGFAGATLQDIAAEAGVSKALVHYHFQSKEQLLVEVQARAYRRVAQVVVDLASQAQPSLPSALTALDRAWEMLFAFRHHVPMSLELWTQATRRPELLERLERFNEEMVALIRAALHTTLGPDLERDLPVPTARLARMLFPLLSGLALHAYFGKDREAVDTAYRDFRSLLERALEPHRRGET
jgi:AcrR family transcriptional regulator